MEEVLVGLDPSGMRSSSGQGLPAAGSDADPPLGRVNSTLGLSTGEPAGSGRKGRRMVLASLLTLSVSLLTVLGGLGLRQAQRTRPSPKQIPADTATATSPPSTPSQPESAPAATPASRHVIWQLNSQPRGAQVVRTRDGMVLGQTPLRHSQEAQPGSETLVLRLVGYQPITMELDRDSNSLVERTLSPLAVSEKAASPSPNHEAAGRTRGTAHPGQTSTLPAARPTRPTSQDASEKKAPNAPPPPRREDFLER